MNKINNEFVKKMNEKDLNKLENDIQLVRRIKILEMFIEEATIDFILEYYPNFLVQISLNSLKRAANFYFNIQNFDYNNLIKWAPIFLDYDRSKILMSYLKKENLNPKEIADFLSGNITVEIATSDKIQRLVCDEKEQNLIKDSEFLNTSIQISSIINENKTKNEGFNNLIDINISKYGPILRRLT